CSKLDLEEEMAPVRMSLGPDPKMNGSFQASLLNVLSCLNTAVQASVFIVKRRLNKSVQTSFLKCHKGTKEAKEPIFRALTASADVLIH
ncbi:hypothetical protein Tco_0275547, partial [Tanacetum coccineum]